MYVESAHLAYRLWWIGLVQSDGLVHDLCQSERSIADGRTDTSATGANRHAEPNTDRYADSDSYAEPNSVADADSVSHAISHSVADALANPVGDALTDGDRERYRRRD